MPKAGGTPEVGEGLPDAAENCWRTWNAASGEEALLRGGGDCLGRSMAG